MSAGTTNPHRGHQLPQPVAAGFRARCCAWQDINSILESPETMTWCINYQPSQKTPRASQPHTALCPTKALSGHLIRYQTSILPTHRKNKLCQKKSSHTNSITDYCYRLMPAKSLISAQADKRPWAPLFTQSYCLSPRIKKNFGPTSSYHRSPPQHHTALRKGWIQDTTSGAQAQPCKVWGHPGRNEYF